MSEQKWRRTQQHGKELRLIDIVVDSASKNNTRVNLEMSPHAALKLATKLMRQVEMIIGRDGQLRSEKTALDRNDDKVLVSVDGDLDARCM